MEQPDGIKRRKKATHLTYRDRTDIETIIRTHWPYGRRIIWAQLGRYMGRSWRIVRTEYRRGRVTNRSSDLVEYDTYSAEKGQAGADALAANKGPRMRLTNILADRLRYWIVDEKVSPYVAIMRMRKEGYSWVPCVRTVYYAIERGDLEIIRANLPYGTINMKPRRRGRRMAYRTLRGKSIAERPPAAEPRIEYGHWEMDTVVGRTGGSSACLLVMTERTTREEIIRRLPDRSQRSVIRALRGLERRPDNLFESMRSLTCDNGSEFWDFEAIERSSLQPKNMRCTLYYTHPFSAFERGSNENNNRIIRRFIPKVPISPTSASRRSASSNRESTPWNATPSEASPLPKPKGANAMNPPLENLHMHLASQPVWAALVGGGAFGCSLLPFTFLHSLRRVVVMLMS